MLIPRIECLKSLSFLNMDQREYLVEGAATNTCTWLLNHGKYKTWLGRRHALLWIVGKPGAGKSTLMRYALQRASHSSDVVASFFFFGRGSDLQKSSCGLFRSLLHQLLDQTSEMLSDFMQIYKKKRETKQEFEWYETELRQFLEQWILSASRDRSISIYVDALDEAGLEVAQNLIAYLGELVKRLGPTRAAFRLCFSCRHYPVLAKKPTLKICVEEENHQDIATYVRQTFMKHQFSDPAEVQELEQEIIEKASHIFQWIVLIIPIIIEADDDGASVRKIRQMIKEIPGELGDLYGHILSRIEDQKRAAQLMQWVCFALRPLSLEELRYAMVVDITNKFTSLEECRVSVDFAETDEQMKRTVNSLSGGLAETVEYKDRQTVRFIHQSVNDYLIERGLRKLDPSFLDNVNHYLSKSGLPSLDASLSDNLVGLAHFRISRSCVKSVAFEQIWEGAKGIGFPTLQYSENWASHAEIVEEQRIVQADLLSLCRWPSGHAIPSWGIASYLGNEPKGRDAWTANLLHIASTHGLLSVIEAMVKSGKSFDFNSKCNGQTALSLAVMNGRVAVVQFLIEQDDVQIDLKVDWGQTPLSSAAARGHESVVRLLIERDDVQINSKDGTDRTPLSWAARRGHEAIVRLLIQRDDIDVTSKDDEGRTPLMWAASYGHEAIVQLLIERDDINIDLKNRWGETLLSLAATNGHKAIVQLLIERGADIDSRDVLGRTPFSEAKTRGHKAVVELLIERDAEVDHSPFLWAIEDGLEAVVRLSIELDLIEVDLKQKWEQNPLSWTEEEKKGAYERLHGERSLRKNHERAAWASGE